MFSIRRIYDDVLEINRRAIEEAQQILVARRLDLTKNLSLWSAEHFHHGLL